MRGVWQLRAARQLTWAALPLVVIGVAVLVVLGIRGSHTGAQLSRASARVDGVVRKIDGHGDPRWATITWADKAGHRHSHRIGFPGNSHPVAGATVGLRYVPGHPELVYADGDITFARANDLVGGVLYVAVLLLVVLVLTVVRILRRVALARRPGTIVKLSRVRTRFGLIQRCWLVASAGNREHWVPVYWEPVLSGLLADTPCTVYGDLAAGGAVVIDVDGHRIWSSGRVRGTTPRGRLTTNPGTYSASASAAPATPAPPAAPANPAPANPAPAAAATPAAPATPATPAAPAAQISLGRQARGDAALVILAPFLGVLWAYINGLSGIGAGIATVVLAGVLFWLPGYYASDPS